MIVEWKHEERSNLYNNEKQYTRTIIISVGLPIKTVNILIL